MRRCNQVLVAAIAAALRLVASTNAAITLGQIDTFQTSDPLGWTIGGNGSLVPSVISAGGPQGANDGYLQLVSTGGTQANSKLIMFNADQWAGNYISAGVTQITAEMANFGSNPLSMRVAFQDSFGTEFASTVAALLPADGLWHAISFDMTPSALTLLQGSSPISQALSDVGVLRILSAAKGPAFIGDTVAATVGFDDITAVPEPATIVPLLAALVARRNRSDRACGSTRSS